MRRVNKNGGVSSHCVEGAFDNKTAFIPLKYTYVSIYIRSNSVMSSSYPVCEMHVSDGILIYLV